MLIVYKRTIEELLDFSVVVIDKPSGPTSHQVSAWVRSILGVKKAGHAGTLDPKVTGVLPVGINRGTRIVPYMHRSPKEYIVLMRLHGDVSDERLNEVLNDFKGNLYQTPPVRSAVKRRLRKRRVHELELIERKGPMVLMRVLCEAGTYMRVLCVDIGDALLVGAHMEELRRTKTGPFSENDAVKLQDLLDAYMLWNKCGVEDELRRILIPPERSLSHLPKIMIKDTAVDALAHGADLYAVGVLSVSGDIDRGTPAGVYSESGELVAVGTALKKSPDIIKSDGIVVDINNVFVNPGKYPSVWKKNK